jgi:hypothetical protein
MVVGQKQAKFDVTISNIYHRLIERTKAPSFSLICFSMAKRLTLLLRKSITRMKQTRWPEGERNTPDRNSSFSTTILMLFYGHRR